MSVANTCSVHFALVLIVCLRYCASQWTHLEQQFLKKNCNSFLYIFLNHFVYWKSLSAGCIGLAACTFDTPDLKFISSVFLRQTCDKETIEMTEALTFIRKFLKNLLHTLLF